MTESNQQAIDGLSSILDFVQHKVIGICRPKNMHMPAFWYMVVDLTDNQITCIRVGQFLGLQTLHIDKDETTYHSFPDEVTLGKIILDPFKFHAWVKQINGE